MSTIDAAAVIEAIPTLSLEEIDARLDEIETTRANAVVEFDKQIASLSYLRRIVDIAQNGKPEPKTRRPRKAREEKPVISYGDAAPKGEPESADSRTAKGRMALYLAHNGPTKVATLAEAIKCTTATIYQLCREDGWFDRDMSGNVKLTSTGARCAVPEARKAG